MSVGLTAKECDQQDEREHQNILLTRTHGSNKNIKIVF